MLQQNLIKPHYQRVITEIMGDHGIPLLPGDYRQPIVAANASFPEVAQHTELFLGGRTDDRPHYRYRRYVQVLRLIPHSERRLAHIDIGCGAGLFSWVFLDWATGRSVSHNQVELYGLDHSTAMITLAREARERLIPQVATYPQLHYADDLNVVMAELTDNYQPGTDYVITFGHVLVQAHAPQNIAAFTQVIVHAVRLENGQATYTMIAVDAQGRPNSFSEGWDSLLASLEPAGVGHELVTVPTTAINDGSRAKCARLSLIC